MKDTRRFTIVAIVAPAAAVLAVLGIVMSANHSQRNIHNLAPVLAPSAVVTTSPSPSAPPLIIHAMDDVFIVGPWKIHVTGVTYDKTDTSTTVPQNVSSVQLDATNVGPAGIDFTPTDPPYTEGTLPVVYAVDSAGAHYTGWVWARGTINPGNVSHNEFVFPVGPGTRFTMIVFGVYALKLPS